MCTMDVGFRSDVNIPRTSSNPGEKSAGELGCRSVLGFSQVNSAQSKCGAVELDFRRANCPPGEIGAEECDYIMPAPLAGSSDLECFPYQGKDCIRDFSAGGTLSPSVSDLSGPRGPYVTDGPVGHPGTLSSPTFMTEILVGPGGMLLPSDLAGMLLPAMPVGPDGRWGTWPPSLTQQARVASLLQVAPSAILGRCPRRPSSWRYCWTREGCRRHPTSPGCCSRLSLLAPLASGEHCRHLILTRLVRMARMVLMVPLAILGHCPRLLPRTRYWRILVGRLPRPTLPG